MCIRDSRRIVRTATEQRPRIQADALHATLAQVAVEQALVLAFVEERRVAYFHGNPSRTQLIEEIQQFAQAPVSYTHLTCETPGREKDTMRS